MTTAFITDPRYAGHHLEGHPENAARLKAITEVLDQHGVTRRMKSLAYEPVTEEQILKVHTDKYLELLQWTETQKGIQLGPDFRCYLTSSS